MKYFNINDIKPGMVVLISIFDEDINKILKQDYCIVTTSKTGICVSGKILFEPLKYFNDDLTSGEYRIDEIYDLSNSNMCAYIIGTEDRELIWKRDEQN